MVMKKTAGCLKLCPGYPHQMFAFLFQKSPEPMFKTVQCQTDPLTMEDILELIGSVDTINCTNVERVDEGTQWPEPVPQVNLFSLEVDHSYCKSMKVDAHTTSVNIVTRPDSSNNLPSLNDAILEKTSLVDPVIEEKALSPITLSCENGYDTDISSDDFMPCSSDTDSSLSDNHSINDNDVNGDENLVTHKKFIVFENELEKLIWRVRCAEPHCDAPVDEVVKGITGSGLTVKLTCVNGHQYNWCSQPVIGRQPACNLLLAGATLFSGDTYTHVKQFADLINLQLMSQTTYDTIQNKYLLPVINKAWETEKARVHTLLDGREVRLCGDGRCDSPGFSAKYCTYTLLDQDTKLIVDFKLVQVSETGSSCTMEKLGYERAMDTLLEEGLKISLCATDRHVQIRKLHREKYAPKNIIHEFDVYHLANSIRKAIKAKAAKKKFSALHPWQRSIVNHLWWSAATCDGIADVLVEKWTSIIHHISNTHKFDENTHFKRCTHVDVEGEVETTPVHGNSEEKRKKWLKKDSPAYVALCTIALNPRLLKDIRMLANFCHTGALEAYHSLILKYAPKRTEFDFNAMEGRLQLAALDHNANTNRKQAVVRKPRKGTGAKGEARFRTRFSKATQRWVAEPVLEQKSYQFARNLLCDVVDKKKTGGQCERKVRPAHIPENIAKIERPNKAELVSKQVTRMRRLE